MTDPSASERVSVNGAPILSSPEAQEILEAALSTIGLTLESWRLDAVHARPGAETSATYDVFASGQRLYLVATTAVLSDAEQGLAQAVRLDSETGSIFIWRHPSDPRLPGLESVSTPAGLAGRLSSAGIVEGVVTELSMLVLRPMRRAVLRAEVARPGEEVTFFVKVLRPDRATLLLQRHGVVGLAPRAWDAGDGVVVTAQAAGRPLTEYLFKPDGKREVKPQALIDALNSVQPEAVDLPKRRTPAELVSTYAAAVIEAGWDASRVREIETAMTRLASDPPGPIVPTHGDFHPANVFVDGAVPATVIAVIDVDTVGPGFRADDLACMLAHLYTLPTFGDELYPGVLDLAHRALEEFSCQVPAEQLRVRTAAVLVSLLMGCDDRDRGKRWLEIASLLVEGATQSRE